jgi:hypothetical protein
MSDFGPTSIHTDCAGAALIHPPFHHTFLINSPTLTLTVRWSTWASKLASYLDAMGGDTVPTFRSQTRYLLSSFPSCVSCPRLIHVNILSQHVHLRYLSQHPVRPSPFGRTALLSHIVLPSKIYLHRRQQNANYAYSYCSPLVTFAWRSRTTAKGTALRTQETG